MLIELNADGQNNNHAKRISMQLQSSDSGEKICKAKLHTTSRASDYTIRILPNYENIAVPSENNYIVWQR